MLHTMYSTYLVRSAAIINASNVVHLSSKHSLHDRLNPLHSVDSQASKSPNRTLAHPLVRGRLFCSSYLMSPSKLAPTTFISLHCEMLCVPSQSSLDFLVRSIDCPVLSLFVAHAGSCASIIPPPKPLKHFLYITRTPRLAFGPPIFDHVPFRPPSVHYPTFRRISQGAFRSHCHFLVEA